MTDNDIEATAERAKPMWGNALYQKRARKAFPILIELSRSGKTITYAALARRLRMASARNLNYVLGSIGASLSVLSAQWKELIPPIEALVINSETQLPGAGVDHFLSRAPSPVPTDRAGQIEYAHREIFRYPKWRSVQSALRGLVRSPPGSAARRVTTPEGDSTASRRYWWVNHKQTHRQELDGEYLWSPKKNQDGANNVSYDNMIHVSPGDVVFSFADAAIRAVGVALGRAREAPKPPEFGSAGDQWGTDPGWQVPVRFKELNDPLRPKDHIAQLAPVLPTKHSPIRASGDDNQGVYLATVPEAMVDKLTELLAGQVDQIVESITQTMGGSLLDDAAEERIQQRTDIGPTVKKSLVTARRGQGVFRVNLEQIELKCRVTGVLDRRHLRASHIKPWCICDDREKLDGFNGLLLSPHVDHLFDRGYISFSDSGDLLVSKEVIHAVLESWGIALPRNVGPFNPEQCRYLEYHRVHVFEKTTGGRRGKSTEDPEAAVNGEPVVVRPE